MSNIKSFERNKRRQLKIFTTLSEKLSAISSPVRLKLIYFLSQAPLSVEILAEKIEQSIANTSMHLRKMLNEDLVTVQQMGQKRIYSLDSAVMTFWEHCQDFLGHLQPSMKDLMEFDAAEINWPHPLKKTIKDLLDKKIALLDVRPMEEVSHDPIKEISYFHVPFDQLKERWKNLPKKIPLLIICRGKYCVLSTEATYILKAKKFKVYRMPYSWFVIDKKIQECI